MFSWVDYVPIVAQAKSYIQEKAGNKHGSIKTRERFMRAYANAFDLNIAFTSCSAHYCSEKKPKISNQAWMAGVPDYKFITELTLPGTHDSGCNYGGEFAKCQSWTIPEQLKAGIRFFDIRCKNVKNEFQIYHGIIDCRLSFKEVIAYCEYFLRENPSEFILMRVKEEGASDHATKSFDDVYREYTSSNDIFFTRSTKHVTVNEARGKIIILKDFWGKGTGSELDYRSSVIQDYFQPPSLESKINKIYRHHKTARPCADRFHINFMTACNSSKHLWPRYIANKCNEKALELLKDGSNEWNFGGIIVMDFPGEELVQTCIDSNHFHETKTIVLRSML